MMRFQNQLRQMLTKIHMAQEDWPITIFQKHTQLYL